MTDDHLDRFRKTINRAVNPAYPLLDVYREEAVVVVRTAPIDGLDPASLEVNMVGAELTISGHTQPTNTRSPEAYLRQERVFGHFSRTITIPVRVQAQQATARVKNQALTVHLPLHQKEPSEIIDIQVAN